MPQLLHASKFEDNSCAEQGCLDWPLRLKPLSGAEKQDAGLNASVL